MATGLPKVNLHLGEAQSCLTVVRSLLAEAMHDDDSAKMRELLTRAESSIDSASAVLNDIRRRLDHISDQL